MKKSLLDIVALNLETMGSYDIELVAYDNAEATISSVLGIARSGALPEADAREVIAAISAAERATRRDRPDLSVVPSFALDGTGPVRRFGSLAA